MEDADLPALGEDADKEKAQGDLEESCCENIEDFAELYVLLMCE